MINMDEPSKKRCIFEDRTENFKVVYHTDNIELANEVVSVEIELLQDHLLQNCICTLPDNILLKLHWWFHTKDALWTNLIADWNRDRTLMLITCVQLICDINMKQCAKGRVCQRLAEVCYTLARKDNRLFDFLVTLAYCPDPFILFIASRALTSLFLILGRYIDPWLDTSVVNVEICEEPSTFSLNVLKNLIEWKDADEHTLEDSVPDERHFPAVCRMLSANVGQFSSAEVKCCCIQSLGPKWRLITPIFEELIKTNFPKYQNSIITFLDLWKAVVSIKTNLSVEEIEPFYVNLHCYVDLLMSNTSAIIWKHNLNLLNEILCYGSTLSLQVNLDEKPCDIATKIIRNVKDRQLLDHVPYREGTNGFGGNHVGEGDKVLLRKVTLLVLKAIAITVKAAHYDSSSDSCGEWVVDTDMAVIERSIWDVIQKLDYFIKRCIEFQPHITLAKWIVKVFVDQDDYLIESMICCLDVTQGICFRNGALPILRRTLNPSETFLQFLKIVANLTIVDFDASLLLDFLISNETHFLLYLLRILKYIIRNFNEFLETCGTRDARKVRGLLNELRERVERQVKKNLFPYNIKPLLNKLMQFEDIFVRHSLISHDLNGYIMY